MKILVNLIANSFPVVCAVANVIVVSLTHVKSPNSANFQVLLENTTILSLSPDAADCPVLKV